MDRVAVMAMEDERGLLDAPAHVLVTGIGAMNVIAALDGLDRSTPLLNVGYAGSAVLPVGTRARIGKVSLHHPKAGDCGDREFDLGGEVPCYTSSDFVTEAGTEEPCVFDMELAFILAMGFTDVEAVKVVSDRLDIGQYRMEVGRHG